MRLRAFHPSNLGEMIVAEFDKAARFSVDPREIARLATLSVARLMQQRARRSLMNPRIRPHKRLESLQSN